jgi:hypothetical protein
MEAERDASDRSIALDDGVVSYAPSWTVTASYDYFEVTAPAIAVDVNHPNIPFNSGVALSIPESFTADMVARYIVAGMMISGLHEALEWVTVDGFRLSETHPWSEEVMWDKFRDWTLDVVDRLLVSPTLGDADLLPAPSAPLGTSANVAGSDIAIAPGWGCHVGLDAVTIRHPATAAERCALDTPLGDLTLTVPLTRSAEDPRNVAAHLVAATTITHLIEAASWVEVDGAPLISRRIGPDPALVTAVLDVIDRLADHYPAHEGQED